MARDVSGALEGLQQSDWALRRAAIMVLRFHALDGNDQAIEGLRRAVNDPHPLNRAAATEALEECAAPIEGLRGTSPEVAAGVSSTGVVADPLDQTETAENLLKFLTGFRGNLAQLTAGLENDDALSVSFLLRVIVAQDLGASLTRAFGLTEPACLLRLADPLKAIEAELNRAGTFLGRPGCPPALNIFVPSKIMVVRSVLTHVYKTGGANPAWQASATSLTPSARPMPLVWKVVLTVLVLLILVRVVWVLAHEGL